MTFAAKIDDKQLKVDLSCTNLADILQYCKAKEQLILIKKFGLQTGKEMPLQQIWAEFGMTRERARQIEKQALMRFRRLFVGNEKYLKVISEAEKILVWNGGIMAEDELVAKLVAKWTFKFSWQELKLILMSDYNLTHLRRNKILNKSFYVDTLYEDLLTNIALYTIKHFEKTNTYESIYDFIDVLKKEFGKKNPDITYLQENQFYLNLLRVIKNMSIFDGKLWLSTFTSVNPKTIKSKLLYVFRVHGKPMHYQDAANMVSEYFSNKQVKITTAHNELVKSNDVFVNVWLGLYSLKERWVIWGTVLEILTRILKKAWRPMTTKEIMQNILKEKMIAPNTVLLNLHKHKNVFIKNDKWMYSLAEEAK